MSNEIFRQKSLEKMNSPEDLNDYIRVSNPGVWLLLISVIVLLIGACIWSIFGKVDSTAPADVHVENGAAVCYVDAQQVDSLTSGMTIRLEDCEGTIVEIGEKTEQGYACTVDWDSIPADGMYAGKIVTAQTRPISFVLN